MRRDVQGEVLPDAQLMLGCTHARSRTLHGSSTNFVTRAEVEECTSAKADVDGEATRRTMALGEVPKPVCGVAVVVVVGGGKMRKKWERAREAEGRGGREGGRVAERKKIQDFVLANGSARVLWLRCLRLHAFHTLRPFRPCTFLSASFSSSPPPPPTPPASSEVAVLRHEKNHTTPYHTTAQHSTSHTTPHHTTPASTAHHTTAHHSTPQPSTPHHTRIHATPHHTTSHHTRIYTHATPPRW
jgi:hypothetical protein